MYNFIGKFAISLTKDTGHSSNRSSLRILPMGNEIIVVSSIVVYLLCRVEEIELPKQVIYTLFRLFGYRLSRIGAPFWIVCYVLEVVQRSNNV